jgi:glycosyltransferase involved in cell wall biosynthesis
VGSNQYAYRVLVELERLTQVSHDEVIVFLASSPVNDLPKERVGWSYVVLKPATLWSMWRLPLALYARAIMGKKLDVFYSLGHYAPRFCPFPSVISVMDVAYLKFPEFFKKTDVWKLTKWTDYSARNATHIITISEQSRHDVMESYHKSEDMVTVAYPGFDEVSVVKQAAATLESLKVHEPYVVYLGTVQPRKNLVRLVKAFEMIANTAKHKSLRLVIGGKIGWMADDFLRAVQQSTVRQRIQVLGYITEEQKLALYARAKAAVLVGLYEGFGIPPLEAMAAGTIPVVAETASLPEVVGPAGVLVDPYSIEDIARGLQEAIEYTSKEREAKLAAGREYMKKFSWQESAAVILDVLHRIGTGSTLQKLQTEQ